MLYIIMLAVISVWMVTLLYKSHLSWHSIITAYAIGVISADLVEVSFNVLLGLYKFPTHLSTNPIYDNELGIIFADTLILPFTLIVFLHYAKKDQPWRTSLPFAILFVLLEVIFLKSSYLTYIRWNLVFSAILYVSVFRFSAYLAPRITNYNPPIPYIILLFSFSHTVIMWAGALFSLPLLKLYQFNPGIFKDLMADCRFTDLLSGDVLALSCAIVIPRMLSRLKLLTLVVIACIGVSFALYSYNNGWLIYHRWNHVFTIVRYFVPILLIWQYDRWESSYRKKLSREQKV